MPKTFETEVLEMLQDLLDESELHCEILENLENAIADLNRKLDK